VLLTACLGRSPRAAAGPPARPAFLAALLLHVILAPARADLAALAVLDAASGYEGPVVDYLRRALGGRQEIDNTGSLTVAFGSGRPHTLLIAGVDEPGYVVTAITDDGYLRLQRLAASPPHRNFEDFFLAQPVRVAAAGGQIHNGVMAALSVHLQSERISPPRLDHPEQLFVDVGARSRQQARQAGLDLLDAVTLEKSFTVLGDSGRLSAPWISGRAGAAVLLALGRALGQAPPAGTVTLAFVSQQYSGHRGLARVLQRVDADRVVWLKHGGGPRPAVSPAAYSRTQIADQIAVLAARRRLELDREPPERLQVPAFAREDPWKHPERAAILGLGVENAGTPVEVVSAPELEKIRGLLAEFVGLAPPTGPLWTPPAASSQAAASTSTLETLTGIYGVSGREGNVRRAIQDLLPEWARRASRTDAKGNLIVELAPTPERLFIAHMDELGFQVQEVTADGKLWAETRGGGTPEFSEWHAGLVHSPARSWPAILLGGAGGGRAHRVQVDLGASSAAQAADMGVKAGDTVALRKRFRTLLGGRANTRSFDDRIGCAVLIDTLRALRPEQIRRPTWFVFAVEEEIGLRGAEFLAESVRPAEVYAIDTFVSSDSPLENRRMAEALLGQGFVIRAADSSGATPRAAVRRVAELARQRGIPVQHGITSGANDGSQFVPGGAINIPLGWPLRYSHSPGELVDLADVQALEKIVRALVVD